MANKLSITTKTDYAVRPSVPSSQKQNATEFNSVVSAVNANYERLVLRWDTDILANTILLVGQYVQFTDEIIYRIVTSYNVGNPITWIGGNAVPSSGGGAGLVSQTLAASVAINADGNDFSITSADQLTLDSNDVQITSNNDILIGSSNDATLDAANILNLGAGSHIQVNAAQIKGIADGTDTQDAVSKAQLDAAALGIVTSWKAPVKVSTTTTGTLASDFENGDTVDGVALVTGDRILIKNQAAATENGIYVVAASGAPARSSDANVAAELEGAAVTVQQGTSNANTTWTQTTDAINLGVSNIVFAQLGTSVPDADATTKGIAKLYQVLGGNSDGAMSQVAVRDMTVDKETPTGLINSSNVTYTLANTPIAGSEHVYLNGLLMESGGGNDYTISGATITMLTAPETGDRLRVSYRK